jgi:hypothetical protein
MLAADLATPPRITAGNPMPTGRSIGRPAISLAVAFATAFGVAGCGVSTRTRGVVSSPVAVSTMAALMPDPPTSMPIISTCAPQPRVGDANHTAR